jgi:isoquinoline 1-oxidoreductase alpha subunit
MTTYTLNINNTLQVVDVDPDTPLLWVLRDQLGLTGTKYSCGAGICGTCTVHLDRQAVLSCQTPISSVGNKEVTTVEGLTEDGSHPLQGAWLAEQVSQCGYCQPGQIMAAAALLNHNPHPNDEEIKAAMSGMLCRCGTYPRILKAIRRAAGGGV